MAKQTGIEMPNEDWYVDLTHLVLASKDSMIQTTRQTLEQMHKIGLALVDNQDKFGKAEYGSHTIEKLSKSVGISKSTLYRSIQFANAYPIIPEEQVSWYKMANKLLPNAKKSHNATIQKKKVQKKEISWKLEETEERILVVNDTKFMFKCVNNQIVITRIIEEEDANQ